MDRKLVLKLPPKRGRAIYYQIFLVMIMFWLRDTLHFPSAITYITDIITVGLLFTRFKTIRRNVKVAKSKIQLVIVAMIIFCMIIGAVLNLVNPLLTLWGVRNNLRFFMFFFICVGLLDEYDVDSLIKIIKTFFWLNLAMCLFQYFVLGLSNDYLGGFFGTQQGSNAYINILLCMIIAIMFGQYYAEKIRIYALISYIIACVLIATLCELKVFYIEVIIITIFTIISMKPSFKTVSFCISGLVGLYIGFIFISRYNPQILSVFTDKNLLEYYLNGNGYTNSGDLNRFTAIQQIYKDFFKGDTFLSLFGFGLGSCEYSSFSFLQSDFYLQYSYLHYRWMTHAWVYLEQGFIGLLLLLLFFISLIIYTVSNRKYVRKDLWLTTLVFLPTCFLGIIYNCALEIEACFLIAFMCALPFIMFKKYKNEESQL